MSLVRRNNSKFWYAQFQIDGQTFVKSTKTSCKKTARKVEAQFRADAHSGLLLNVKKKVSFGDALNQFIEDRKNTASYNNLLSRKKLILKLIKPTKPLHKVGSADLHRIKLHMDQQGLAAQTIKHYLNNVTGAIKLAKQNGIQTFPDIVAPKIKIRNTKDRFLTLDEERRLLSELDPNRETNGLSPVKGRSKERIRHQQDNYDLICLLLDTGARYSEIATLEWRQIDLSRRTINLWRSKVQNQSILMICDRSLEILKRRDQTRQTTNRNKTCLFENKKGGPRGYQVLAIRKAFARAGLTDCTIHTLRHTHASRLVQMGMSIYEVQQILGHCDVKTTMRYSHLEQVEVHQRAVDLINRLSSIENLETTSNAGV